MYFVVFLMIVISMCAAEPPVQQHNLFQGAIGITAEKMPKNHNMHNDIKMTFDQYNYNQDEENQMNLSQISSSTETPHKNDMRHGYNYEKPKQQISYELRAGNLEYLPPKEMATQDLEYLPPRSPHHKV